MKFEREIVNPETDSKITFVFYVNENNNADNKVAIDSTCKSIYMDFAEEMGKCAESKKSFSAKRLQRSPLERLSNTVTLWPAFIISFTTWLPI